ncbi:hypothetical protein GCM10017673_23050 [Streptosporangium violaceochromogenes]|nr:hypothetical protein GCM10017673_23050 [Streptosporangium violaceochromogenes]
MRVGDSIQVHQACGLLAQVQAIQRFNAEAGLCFARIGFTGKQATLVVEHPNHPPLHLKVEYDISCEALRALLTARGLPARPEPADYDYTVMTPRPHGPGLIRHGYALHELCDTSAWTDYHLAQPWQGELTDIVYEPDSTDLLMRLDGMPWRVRVRLSVRHAGDLVGAAYNVVDRIGNLLEKPSAEQREQMCHGEVLT